MQSAEELGARAGHARHPARPAPLEDDFVALAQHLGLQGVTYFVGWSAWLDIAPDGVNKATALAEVAADLGVKAEVLAAGDGRNDIEMLRWAGRGVAMGDAPDEVKAGGRRGHRPFAEGGTVPELLRWFG